MIAWFSKNNNFNQAIREISFNIARGNVYLSPSAKRKLKSHAKLIVKLAGATNGTVLRRYVNQSGGYLNVALPAVIALVQMLGEKFIKDRA